MKKIIISAFTLSIFLGSFACKSNKQPTEQVQTDTPPKGGRQDRTPPNADEIFAQMDANKDGKLTIAEVKGRLKDDFSKIDTNSDGFITKTELQKAPKPNRQGPPPDGGQGGPPPRN